MITKIIVKIVTYSKIKENKLIIVKDIINLM